jgi:hypothetical protein
MAHYLPVVLRIVTVPRRQVILVFSDVSKFDTSLPDSRPEKGWR